LKLIRTTLTQGRAKDGVEIKHFELDPPANTATLVVNEEPKDDSLWQKLARLLQLD
jgi:hypothetical protein